MTQSNRNARITSVLLLSALCLSGCKTPSADSVETNVNDVVDVVESCIQLGAPLDASKVASNRPADLGLLVKYVAPTTD